MPVSVNNTVSVIIPVYNEVRTVSTVIEIVRTWKRCGNIVVVDDGSTDGTYKSILRFTPGVRVIRHKKNEGKAAAVIDGLKHVTSDIVLCLDGDIIGLSHKDLDTLVRPVLSNGFGMSVGIARFWSVGKFEPFNSLSGFRVFRVSALPKDLSSIRPAGYGFELYLNSIFKRKSVRVVRLPHVFVLGKWDKYSVPDALRSYTREIKELLKQLLSQLTGEMGPHAKRIKDIAQKIMRVLDALS